MMEFLKTIGEDGYYVSIHGSNDVRIINISKGDSLLIDLKKILVKNIFDMQIESVVKYEIEKKGQERVVVEKIPDEKIDNIRYAFETFKVLEPIESFANSVNNATAVFWSSIFSACMKGI